MFQWAESTSFGENFFIDANGCNDLGFDLFIAMDTSPIWRRLWNSLVLNSSSLFSYSLFFLFFFILFVWFSLKYFILLLFFFLHVVFFCVVFYFHFQLPSCWNTRKQVGALTIFHLRDRVDHFLSGANSYWFQMILYNWCRFDWGL